MKSPFLPSFITFVVASQLLFLFYSGFILETNSHLFSNLGDGLKNYYTCLYHAYFSEDFVLMTGMNYPNYEHMIYIDAMPLVGWILQLFSSPENGVGLLNLLILFNIPLAAVFIFLILRAFKVNIVWSMASSITLAFLAPQIDRFGGHLGLSFGFLIPCYWWLLIKYEDTKKWIWLWSATVVGLASFFIHPYMGLIISAIGLLYFGLKMLKRRDRLTNFLALLISGAIPVLGFRLFMGLTDPQSVREPTGQGFFDYYGQFESLLHPRWPESLYYLLLDWGVERQPWESASYLGFATILFLCFAAVFVLRKNVRSLGSLIWSQAGFITTLITGIPTAIILINDGFSPRGALEFIMIWSVVRLIFTIARNEQPQSIKVFLVAAALLMLFGMCIPFKYEVFRPLVSILGPLSEFRSLGRFLWVIYYALGVVSVIWLYRIYSDHRRLAGMVFIIGITISTVEWGFRHTELSAYARGNTNVFNKNTLSSEYREVINFLDEYHSDAIVYLPFFHFVGTYISKEAPAEMIKSALMLSYHTKSPLFNLHSTRIPIDQSAKSLELFTPDYVHKKIIEDIPAGDRIVVVHQKDYQLPAAEMYTIDPARMIFENQEYAVYAYQHSLDIYKAAIVRMIAAEETAKAEVSDFFRSPSEHTFVHHINFDELSSPIAFFGDGAFTAEKKNFNVIAEIETEQLDLNTYEVSFYYLLTHGATDRLACLEANYIDGSKVWIDTRMVSETYFTVNDWGKVDLRFTASPEMKSVKLLITGQPTNEKFILDELVVRKLNDPPVFSNVEDKNGNQWKVVNNFWLSPDLPELP